MHSNRHSVVQNSGKKLNVETEVEFELPQKKFGARPELTTKQKLELSKAFGIFDPRGCGLIEQRGFMLAMRALGFEPKFSQVDDLIAMKYFQETKVTGRTDNETLDFKDFYNLLTVVMTGDDSKDDVRKAFKMFSSPETGVISLENLEVINQELGQDISREKLQEMITFADKNGDGVIDLQEFIAMMERPMLE
ncbi:caltractin [Biomphalaria pfeifferi]|uniref:Caltractin n=1 Tax=Biomphalaria pfeifferi TaxID=112525 RepID=A0AAD8BME7_BIOPF|nr:caltractin [Biomphalaria pfeifferi]